MSTVETLRRILELERAKGYEDTAVIGGLQAYLKGCASELSRIVTGRWLAEFQRLQASGVAYAKWSRERRREWAQELMAFLDKLEEKRSGETGKTGGNLTPPTARAYSRPIRSGGKTGQQFLEVPIDTLKGVGVGMVGRLGKLGVRTLRDLLYFFPRRHLDYSQSRPIRDLVVGEEQTIIANVWQ
ncbi:MAG: DNA helicase RecG, partial [Dehalococcoidia bacterium]|nr:DNA helicase RecG [Dehalococcoidia bacterium]